MCSCRDSSGTKPSLLFALGVAFTHIILLAPGGYEAYNGLIGDQARSMVAYFEAIPGVPPLPHKTNPASWMLAVAYGDKEVDVHSPVPRTPSDDIHTTTSPIAARYADSALASAALRDASAEVGEQQRLPKSAVAAVPPSTQFGASFVSQVAVLALRFWRETLRGPEFTAMRIFLTFFLARASPRGKEGAPNLLELHTRIPASPEHAVFFGLIWRNAASNVSDQGSALTMLGVMAAGNIFMSIVTFASVLPILAMHREVFYREKAAVRALEWA